MSSVTTAHVRLCTKTGEGNWWDGGTDADVRARLLALNGCISEWADLETPANDFEQENNDCFRFDTTSVGEEVSF